MVDSKGNVAPVKVIATPNTFNSVIVGDRAASENGNWNLTVEMTDEVTADNINKVFKGTGANADKEILYALCVMVFLILLMILPLKQKHLNHLLLQRLVCCC